MNRILHAILVAFVCLLMAPEGFAQADFPGTRDYPGIERMPNTFTLGYVYKKFDSFDFPITENKKEKKQQVEGALYFYHYKIKNGVEPGSALETVRNYQNAARAVGGQVLYEYTAGINRRTTIRLRKGITEIWLHINAYTYDYELTIIEKQAMEQQIAMDAAAMAGSIANTGSVAIYGIYFDTAKSNLKPESGPAIVEIAKLLAGNPTLKVYIVGHTDMVGDANANQMLSQARAQSVINELITRHGISDARMTARGLGPYAPVASNKTEEGRAKNRRVELVEIATR
jgi:outer membrane protein OmpA-like peptidoglycan-associated protein